MQWLKLTARLNIQFYWLIWCEVNVPIKRKEMKIDEKMKDNEMIRWRGEDEDEANDEN